MRMQCLTHKQEVGAVHGVLSDLHLARSATAFRAKRRSVRTQQHLCTRKCKRAQRNCADMAKCERKIADKHRVFQRKWEEEFAFVVLQNMPVCLIMPKRPVAVMKRDNLKRHHDTHNQNKEFADEYPPGNNIRKEKKNKHLHDCLRTATSAYQPDLG